MHQSQLTPQEKFSAGTLYAKQALKRVRRSRGLKMKQGADLLGVSLKKLEDLEAVADYGSQLNWENILSAAKAYEVDITTFVQPQQ